MNRIVVLSILLGLLVPAGNGQQSAVRNNKQRNVFPQMLDITRVATVNVPGNPRLVFAAETDLVHKTELLEKPSLSRWVVSVQPYPDHYRVLPEVSGGAPCMSEYALKEWCAIEEIPGEPVFVGIFRLFGDTVDHFEGRRTSTARKVLAFRGQLEAHPEWDQSAVIAALNSAGAKYGPDKKQEFMAIVPIKALERVYGPLRLDRVVSVKPIPSGWAAYWQVRAISVSNPKKRLYMYFDPFEGELQLLYVDVPAKVWDEKTRTFKRKYLQD